MAWEVDRRALLATAAGGAALLLLRHAPAPAKFEVTKTDAQWRSQLGGARFAVLRKGATEKPYSNPLNKEHRRGAFLCAGCALPLFTSATKFESDTGWPSFFRPLAKAVATRPDHSLGMKRTEVLCRRCGGHLGHVFRDGPKPTGLRYCINGLALRFRPA